MTNERLPFTISAIRETLNNKGINTTVYHYELCAEEYERYSSGETYSYRFSCPGDYLAYLSMILHRSMTKDEVVDFIADWVSSEDGYEGDDNFTFDEFFKALPGNEGEMHGLASGNWWGDGDDYILLLKNLDTGDILYVGDSEYHGCEDDDDWGEDEE